MSAGAGGAWVSGLVARPGDLDASEALDERIFATARESLDQAGWELDDIDAVVLAADDVSDGRSITTMLTATAAGAYFRDEIRTTNGSLTALGLAALRIQSGLSRRVAVSAWWLPTAGADAIGAATLDPAYGKRVCDPERLLGAPAEGGCAACVVGAEPTPGSLRLDGFSFQQADYHRWLGGTGEPETMLERLGRALAERCGPLDGGRCVLRCSAVGDASAWGAFAAALGPGAPSPTPAGGRFHGLADGLVSLERTAAALGAGERAVVAAAGLPELLTAEAVVVSRVADA